MNKNSKNVMDTYEEEFVVTENEDILVRNMMQSNDITVLVPSRVSILGGEKKYVYTISGCKALREFGGRVWTLQEVLVFLRSIAEVCHSLENYLIPLNYVQWNENSVFLDSEGKVQVVCVPIKRESNSLNLKYMLMQFLTRVVVRDAGFLQFRLRILNYLQVSSVWDTAVFSELVCREMKTHDEGLCLKKMDGSPEEGLWHPCEESSDALKETTLLTEDKDWHKEESKAEPEKATKKRKWFHLFRKRLN